MNNELVEGGTCMVCHNLFDLTQRKHLDYFPRAEEVLWVLGELSLCLYFPSEMNILFNGIEQKLTNLSTGITKNGKMARMLGLGDTWETGEKWETGDTGDTRKSGTHGEQETGEKGETGDRVDFADLDRDQTFKKLLKLKLS